MAGKELTIAQKIFVATGLVLLYILALFISLKNAFNDRQLQFSIENEAVRV
jgi:hypothetical protein